MYPNHKLYELLLNLLNDWSLSESDQMKSYFWEPQREILNKALNKMNSKALLRKSFLISIFFFFLSKNYYMCLLGEGTDKQM